MQALVNGLAERARRVLSGDGPLVAAEIALVAAIAIVAALLTWRVLPSTGPMVDTRIPSAPPGELEDTDAAAVDIASLHLFGTAAGDAQRRPEAIPTEAPETRLNLKLKGVFATGRGDGLAIIAVGNRDQSVFGVGDQVAGNAHIDGIYSDRVILERDGSLETLRLVKEDVPVQAAASGARGTGDRDLQRIAGKARELRSRLMQNPLQLARMVRFQPYLRDGELVGYRIQPRAADAQLLAELGLRPTDVITAVNGVSLSDPARAQQVLQQMQSARVITVSWLRDGEQRQMTIPIGAPS